MPSVASTTRSALLPWLALTIVLAGCSSSSAPPPADTDSPAAAYVRTSDWDEGDSAVLEGTVALENGCITVVDDAEQVIVPVFPTDFTWDKESSSLAGLGHTVSVGDSVSLAGGYHEAPPSSAEHLPNGCDGDQYFIVHSA